MLARPRAGKFIVLGGNSHKKLTSLVCEHLGVREGDCRLFFKSNFETHLALTQSVRGCNVFIIQTGSKDTNNDIMETIILSYACKSASCAKVILIMPYLPYSRHCRRHGRSTIECQLIAQMLKNSGVDMLITVDLYADEIQGFFQIPVENLRASSLFLRYLKENLRDVRQSSVIVALDARSVHRASHFASELCLSMAFIHCRNRVPDESASAEVIAQASQKRYHLVGEVRQKLAIIIGNLIDDSERFSQAAALLHRKGASKIVAIATHGLIYDMKMQEIESSHIDQLILTNSLPVEDFQHKYPKLRTVDISQLIAEAVRRIHHTESLSGLYLNTDEGKTDEDDD